MIAISSRRLIRSGAGALRPGASAIEQVRAAAEAGEIVAVAVTGKPFVFGIGADLTGIAHITTRQDFQLHFIHIENAPAIMRRLGAVGITTREACGNAVRNVTGCPYAGVCACETFDITPYARAAGVFTQDFAKAHRLARDLGPTNCAMILRNHGTLTCAALPSVALSKMRYLIEACQVQVAVLGMGREVLAPTPGICEHAAKQFESFQAASAPDEWAAYLRIADRLDPSYRD